METRTITVREGLFQAELHQGGSGEPLLFLHGSGGLHEGDYLEKLAKTFTVYAPVHPGFGDSTGDELIVDIIDLALYIHDVLDELGIESTHVVGHSLGGLLAAEMAALCSHRVRRLVLANPVGFWRDDDPVLDFFSMPPDQLIPYVIHDPDSETVKASMPAPQTQDEMVEMMFRRIQSFAAATKYLWPIPDKGLKRRIHRVQSPTLIIWGESDRLVSPSYAEDFRTNINDSRVVIMKETAHMPMYEKPEEFASLITDFLRET